MQISARAHKGLQPFLNQVDINLTSFYDRLLYITHHAAYGIDGKIVFESDLLYFLQETQVMSR